MPLEEEQVIKHVYSWYWVQLSFVSVWGTYYGVDTCLSMSILPVMFASCDTISALRALRIPSTTAVFALKVTHKTNAMTNKFTIQYTVITNIVLPLSPSAKCKNR
ncbi:hypothetical protein EB796_024703 [Bugula neritina]|uniref:Uncharacterized protein n=1 Tax=Bugula neritina TaxID=10212 RepID=A0A7J7IST4_BUGNE|nr:hypothetical protein EB796_024703 [Bugula neritina]